MSIKFWKAEKSEDVFVRFDKPLPSGVVVYLCDESGKRALSGNILGESGKVIDGIERGLASRAGISLDADCAIDRDSLAQICAEMAKRIQGE